VDPKSVVDAVDYDKAASIIVEFIVRQVGEAGARGVVVGLSGGLDSTVAAALAVKALGSERVLGLIMPSVFTPVEDVRDAEEVAERLGIRTRKMDITPIVESFKRSIPDYVEDRLASGNLLPRIRMTILYYYANRENLLVLGTGDRSELLLGYFTKYGDGGVDLLPIGGLYKLQVREMARRLGFSKIAAKPSSPRLWPGHMAEAELGAAYDVIDSILFAVFDMGKPVDEVKRVYGSAVDLVLQRVQRNRHKLSPPPIPDLAPARRNV